MREFLESRAGIMLTLLLALMVFSGAVVYTAIVLPANERIYLFLTGIAGNLSGALLAILHVKPKTDEKKDSTSQME